MTEKEIRALIAEGSAIDPVKMAAYLQGLISGYQLAKLEVCA